MAAFVLRFGQDFAGVGGDITIDHHQCASPPTETKVLNEEVTLRADLRGRRHQSASARHTRVIDRFFGNGKIRGFEPNGIGPRDLTAPNQDALGGNLFRRRPARGRFPAGPARGIRHHRRRLPRCRLGLGPGRHTPAAPVDDSFDICARPSASRCSGPRRSARCASTSPRRCKKEDYDKEQNFDLTVSTTVLMRVARQGAAGRAALAVLAAMALSAGPAWSQAEPPPRCRRPAARS